MKPLNVKNYGSIAHLSNSKLGTGDHFINEGQEHICTVQTRDEKDLVIVMEKYDGSNIGVLKQNYQLIPLTRSGYRAETSPYKQHHKFAKWLAVNYSLFDFLQDNERVVGEWMLEPHGLMYDFTVDPIVFFDWFNKNNKRYTFDKLEASSLPLARILHKGSAISTDKLLPILNQKTLEIKSQEDPEGMIYRVERNNKVDFLAKWVRSDFTPGKYLK